MNPLVGFYDAQKNAKSFSKNEKARDNKHLQEEV